MTLLLGLFKKLIIVILIGLVISVFLVIFNQNKLLFPGMRKGSIEEVAHLKAPEGIDELFLKTSDGEQIQVWPRILSKEPDTLAIILTGNGDSIYAAGEYYQNWLAEELGISSIAFSYRGYGKSTGSPSEKGLKRDIEAVFEHARSKIKPKKLLIFAYSIGTGPGSYIALNNEADALILMSPYTSLKDVVSKKSILRFFTPFLKTNFANIEEFKNAKNFPCTSIVHGGRDNIIPSTHSEKLYEAVKENENTRLKIFKEAGHNNIFSFAKEYLKGEIERCLGEGKGKPYLQNK